MGKETKL